MAEDLQRQSPGLLSPESIELIEAAGEAPSLLERLAEFSIDEGRRAIEQRLAAFDPESIATILYSSGTSGEPKAVALTHANISSNAYAVIVGLSEPSSERRMNFLPFSHIYARTCDLYAWLVGGSQIVLAKSRDTVIADCARTQPTLINGVPYFYQRVGQKIAEAEAAGAAVTLPQLFGGNLRACICGGAALPVATFDFYHERGLLMLPGYGLTESSPVISISSPEEFRRGAVGKAIPGIEVRIADDGELLTRGPHVMKEYWKDRRADAADHPRRLALHRRPRRHRRRRLHLDHRSQERADRPLHRQEGRADPHRRGAEPRTAHLSVDGGGRQSTLSRGGDRSRLRPAQQVGRRGRHFRRVAGRPHRSRRPSSSFTASVFARNSNRCLPTSE